MPRKRRLDAPGVIHHATVRGVDGEAIFLNDEDRVGYRIMLAATVRRYRWRCLAYCLMGNHVHLLIETEEANFSLGMQWLHGHYGAAFNKEHQRDGHLFQGRFHDEPILTEPHLAAAVGYIAVNPVKDGFCRDARDWPWSSHHDVVTDARRAWLAHGHLLSKLHGVFGADRYDWIVEAHQRNCVTSL